MQIAVRLPDSMVRQLDAVVSAGVVESRTELVTNALEREIRRIVAARDAAILRGSTEADDLDLLVDWSVGDLDLDFEV